MWHSLGKQVWAQKGALERARTIQGLGLAQTCAGVGLGGGRLAGCISACMWGPASKLSTPHKKK